MNIDIVKSQTRRVIEAIQLLRNHTDYNVDPYESILNKFQVFFDACSSNNIEPRQTDWIRYTAYRLVHEAPIDSNEWRNLLSEIDVLKSLLA